MAMPHGPANFYSTVVKPYYTKEVLENKQHYDDQPEENNKLTAKTTEPTTKNTEPTARNEVQYHGQG
jgi:hypothetical protein